MNITDLENYSSQKKAFESVLILKWLITNFIFRILGIDLK